MDTIALMPAVLWWLGVVVLIAVVIPLVVLVAHRLLTALLEIRRYATDALGHASGIVDGLESLPALTRTRSLTTDVREGLSAYVAGLRGGDSR